MNNKELTERVEDIKKKYIHYSTSIGDSNIFYMSEDDYRSFERELTDLLAKAILSNDEIKREAVEEFLKSQIEYEAEEYAVCPLCKRELIWGETYCPDDRRKLITETRNKLEWSNRNTVIKELIESLTQKENNE